MTPWSMFIHNHFQSISFSGALTDGGHGRHGHDSLGSAQGCETNRQVRAADRNHLPIPDLVMHPGKMGKALGKARSIYGDDKPCN